jgi:hypothetical protein
MAEAAVTSCCVDLARGICSPPSDPSARRIKALPGTQSSRIPHLSTLFREPRKRKRELRATAGNLRFDHRPHHRGCLGSSSGSGKGCRDRFTGDWTLAMPGLLAGLCVNPEIRRRRGLVSLVAPTRVITPPYYST